MSSAHAVSPPVGQVAVVIPVYNDWASLNCLLRDLDALAELGAVQLHVIAVDDASTQALPAELFSRVYQQIASVRVVRQVCNLGHQRAIAVGLACACEESRYDAVIVMDSDGEDLPGDVPRLLELARLNPGAVACAQRRKRSEALVFRSLYKVYKFLFKSMTGTHIDFGNFCLLPRAAADALVHSPSTWNHLAAAVTRARWPLARLPTTRGQRYAGSSHMNLVSLVLHGMSAISVYSDVVMVRVILSLLSISVLAALALVATVAVRVFTDLAIPGWASFVGTSLIIILLQSLVFSFLLVFMTLSQRSVKPVIPALDARVFVKHIDTLMDRSATQGGQRG